MDTYLLIVVLAIIFALNMGGSNFAGAFAAAAGSRMVSRRSALILFTLCVITGAILLGNPVAKTLRQEIIPAQLLTPRALSIFLFSAGISMYIANVIHVPQSTSLVTVAALAGIGVSQNKVFTGTVYSLALFWILLPMIGFILSYGMGKLVYPPRERNFWLYEKVVNHHKRLQIFVIAASCYNAFSVGANNIANVVGPLSAADVLSPVQGFLLAGLLFGFGAIIFSGPIKSASQGIIPLGIFTSTIVCVVTGTLMIIASVCGVPQSFVMIKVACVSAIATVKDGHRVASANPVARKTYLTWGISPFIAFGISYLLMSVVCGTSG